MKNSAIIAVSLLFILSCQPGIAKSLEAPAAIKTPDVKGMEWLQISMNKRSECILASMATLNARGVPLEKSAEEYDHAISEELRYNPNYYDLTVTNILAGIAYKSEPAARKAIDNIKRMQTQKIAMH
jgi:hypothetical protein